MGGWSVSGVLRRSRSTPETDPFPNSRIDPESKADDSLSRLIVFDQERFDSKPHYPEISHLTDFNHLILGEKHTR